MSRLILCHVADYPYVEEYIESFRYGDELVKYDDKTPPFTENRYYLCVRRVPKALLPANCTIGFVNTEQLTLKDRLEQYNIFAPQSTEIFDYSKENIKITGKGTHLPYKELASETTYLKECMASEKKYDIAVVGTSTPHRDAIVLSIKKFGFNVDYICEFKEKRDSRVGQAKILLNIHAGPDYKLYESVRCERWRFAGMKIVSEPCSDEIPEGILTYPEGDMMKFLVSLLGMPKRSSQRIGLCMIVKDESHIIHEVLKCTLDMIDTYVIVDTGSSDNTIECINNFYSKTDVRGHVFERKWKGFGKSRSEALSLCDGYMDYILMIDADDLMEFPPSTKMFLKKLFEDKCPNACNVHLKRGNIEYERVQIFKARDGWRYVGVLHEYPTNDKSNNIIIKLPKNIFMTGRTMGNRSLLEGNKYKRDAETILEALKEEPDNERYMFYLAQSYRDAGMHEESIHWYKKRFEVGKWFEEQFISALNLTRMTCDKEWAWKGHEVCPTRSESLVSYMMYCRSTGKWSRELLAMALYASTITKPTGSVLFLEPDIYDWRVWDELGIIAYYCGQKEISKMACSKLLSENKFPPDQRQRIETNLRLSSC